MLKKITKVQREAVITIVANNIAPEGKIENTIAKLKDESNESLWHRIGYSIQTVKNNALKFEALHFIEIMSYNKAIVDVIKMIDFNKLNTAAEIKSMLKIIKSKKTH